MADADPTGAPIDINNLLEVYCILFFYTLYTTLIDREQTRYHLFYVRGPALYSVTCIAAHPRSRNITCTLGR